MAHRQPFVPNGGPPRPQSRLSQPSSHFIADPTNPLHATTTKSQSASESSTSTAKPPQGFQPFNTSGLGAKKDVSNTSQTPNSRRISGVQQQTPFARAIEPNAPSAKPKSGTATVAAPAPLNPAQPASVLLSSSNASVPFSPPNSVPSSNAKQTVDAHLTRPSSRTSQQIHTAHISSTTEPPPLNLSGLQSNSFRLNTSAHSSMPKRVLATDPAVSGSTNIDSSSATGTRTNSLTRTNTLKRGRNEYEEDQSILMDEQVLAYSAGPSLKRYKHSENEGRTRNKHQESEYNARFSPLPNPISSPLHSPGHDSFEHRLDRNSDGGAHSFMYVHQERRKGSDSRHSRNFSSQSNNPPESFSEQEHGEYTSHAARKFHQRLAPEMSQEDEPRGRQPALDAILGKPTDVIIEDYMEKYEALQVKWRECTMDEWVAGAKEIAAKAAKIMEHTTTHMTKKIILFADFDKQVDGHKTTLDERQKTLEGAKTKLLKDGGSLLGKGP